MYYIIKFEGKIIMSIEEYEDEDKVWDSIQGCKLITDSTQAKEGKTSVLIIDGKAQELGLRDT